MSCKGVWNSFLRNLRDRLFAGPTRRGPDRPAAAERGATCRAVRVPRYADPGGARSSAGQSSGLIIRLSQVRVLAGPLEKACKSYCLQASWHKLSLPVAYRLRTLPVVPAFKIGRPPWHQLRASTQKHVRSPAARQRRRRLSAARSTVAPASPSTRSVVLPGRATTGSAAISARRFGRSTSGRSTRTRASTGRSRTLRSAGGLTAGSTSSSGRRRTPSSATGGRSPTRTRCSARSWYAASRRVTLPTCSGRCASAGRRLARRHSTYVCSAPASAAPCATAMPRRTRASDCPTRSGHGRYDVRVRTSPTTSCHG